MQIIGIDFSTDPEKTGFALGRKSGSRCCIEKAHAGTTDDSNIDVVAAWLDSSVPSLVCIDAPLGWPILLSQCLAAHQAGDVISTEPNKVFRRKTDRKVKRRLNKQPLDVGADRIARTAHAALSFLKKLRVRSGEPLPLAWSPTDLDENKAIIEVYPAATLVAYGFPDTGYKEKTKTAHRSVRSEIREKLGTVVDLSSNLDRESMIKNSDALDAAVCVLAGYDFVTGCCPGPNDLERAQAQKEGWIWVRSPRPNECDAPDQPC